MLVRRVIYTISILLLIVGAVMHWSLDDGEVQLQSSGVKVTAADKASKKDNPYVIRDGSNAMPKGMGQNDDSKFMPNWQKDKIKDMKGEPVGEPSQSPSNSSSSSSSSSSQPSSSHSSGGGITPATTSNDTGDSGTRAMP